MTRKKIQTRLDCDKHKNKTLRKRIGSFLLTIILLAFVSYEVIAIIDQNKGYSIPFIQNRVNVITTGSMSTVDKSNEERLKDFDERIYRGDLIFTTKIKSFDDIKINDVITYYNGVTLVCHRVVDKVVKEDSSSYVITQGDANNTIDGLIPYSWVRGKVINVVHYLGYVTLYIQSPYGIFAISFIALVIIVSLLINEILKSKETDEVEVDKEKYKKLNANIIKK